MTDDLRTRLVALLTEARIVSKPRVMDDGYVSVFIRSDAEAAEVAADVVIRELDDQFLNFGLWLSEELRGEPMSRIDAESCLQDWKWLNDESRWLRGEDDA